MSDEEAELIRIRRHLHAHPELSLREHETATFIEEQLSSIDVESHRLAQTGVVAVVLFAITIGLLSSLFFPLQAERASDAATMIRNRPIFSASLALCVWSKLARCAERANQTEHQSPHAEGFKPTFEHVSTDTRRGNASLDRGDGLVMPGACRWHDGWLFNSHRSLS